MVMNPGSKYTIQDNSVFFCIANDEDSLDAIRREEGETSRTLIKGVKEVRSAVI